ncbi:hypothetical protein [Bhargavaea cecembensis]|uniref:hypothetical protein n=1 Tax=Bhargavaea cecembensis TaxID=394098 RepID=UPI000590204A|nr:hypothetical protein [Bhargavaea cecembensis]
MNPVEKDRIQQLEDRLERMYGNDLDSAAEEICLAVKDLFGFDYHRIPVLIEKREDVANCEFLAEKLKELPELTAEHVCPLLLRLFGTNLEGIVAMEKAPISIRSKENWVKRHDGDLVMITGGHRDLDVIVSPTEAYMTVTGNERLPDELLDLLVEIGFERRDGHAFHEEPDGKPVPVEFKTATIRTITDYFEEHPLSGKQ